MNRRRIALALAGTAVGGLMFVRPALAQGADALSIEDVQFNLNNIFILIAAVLVIFMQAGFALLAAGLTRSKNVANIMMKNLMDFCLGVLMFFVIGYAIAYGTSTGGLFGSDGFFLSGTPDPDADLTKPVDFLFQAAFAATAATIVAGALAERTKFKAYIIYSVVITALIYPVVVHWQWGGGWLSEFGFVDFAGSGIVHLTGGMAALMGAIIIGPRIGKYGPDGKPRAIPGHNIPFAVTGALILLIGWYGFNGGSVLLADGAEVTQVALTTTLAAVAGAITAMITIWVVSGKPDVAMAANGLLAGLVGITASPDLVANGSALIIGAVGGLIVVGSVLLLDKLKVDDPVGAISVHGTCGIWGLIAVGLFAAEDGLFFGGGISQLVNQLVGAVSIMAFVGVTTAALFLVIKATIGLRVDEEEEMNGLDVMEHGSKGYGEDPALTSSTPFAEAGITAGTGAPAAPSKT
jgi:Amt family ammonium transporter